MYDDHQRRLDALHRLAQEQLRAQQPAQQPVKEAAEREGADADDLVVEPLTPSAGAATSVSTRLSRRSQRGLAWALVGGLGLVAVVLVGLFARGRFVPAPTPTPTIGPGNALIVTSNVNFGSVTLNGKAVPGAFPLLVRLNPGENTITYSAPPFRDQTCRVTLLPQADASTGQRVQAVDDGCAVNTQEPALSLNGVVVSNGYLNFERTGADLPEAARNAAESAVWAKLDRLPGVQVPTGDYYATGVDASGRIRSARAAISLLATPALFRVASTPQGVESCLSLNCPGYPVLPGDGGGATPAGVWLVRVSAARGWTFTTRSGAVVAPVTAHPGVTLQVGLTYNSTAGWGIVEGAPGPYLTDLQSQVFSASCQLGFSVLQTLVAKSSLAGRQLSFGSHGNGGLTPAQTDGCALKIEAATNNPLTPTAGNKQYGHYVWRWGVLLAADAQARAQFPSLPSAPQSEITAVGGIDF
jgi:hypothetical protein